MPSINVIQHKNHVFDEQVELDARKGKGDFMESVNPDKNSDKVLDKSQRMELSNGVNLYYSIPIKIKENRGIKISCLGNLRFTPNLVAHKKNFI